MTRLYVVGDATVGPVSGNLTFFNARHVYAAADLPLVARGRLALVEVRCPLPLVRSDDRYLARSVEVLWPATWSPLVCWRLTAESYLRTARLSPWDPELWRIVSAAVAKVVNGDVTLPWVTLLARVAAVLLRLGWTLANRMTPEGQMAYALRRLIQRDDDPAVVFSATRAVAARFSIDERGGQAADFAKLLEGPGGFDARAAA